MHSVSSFAELKAVLSNHPNLQTILFRIGNGQSRYSNSKIEYLKKNGKTFENDDDTLML